MIRPNMYNRFDKSIRRTEHLRENHVGHFQQASRHKMLDFWSHLSANVLLLVIKGYLSNSKIPYLPIRKKSVHLRIIVSDPNSVLRIYSTGVCYVRYLM